MAETDPPNRAVPVRWHSMKVSSSSSNTSGCDTDGSTTTTTPSRSSSVPGEQQPVPLPRTRSFSFSDGSSLNRSGTTTNDIHSNTVRGMVSTSIQIQQQPSTTTATKQHFYDPTIAMMRSSMVGNNTANTSGVAPFHHYLHPNSTNDDDDINHKNNRDRNAPQVERYCNTTTTTTSTQIDDNSDNNDPTIYPMPAGMDTIVPTSTNTVRSNPAVVFPNNNNHVTKMLSQIPAIVLIGIFHLMIGIPFGVSYFPIGWRSNRNDDDSADASIDSNHTNNDSEDDGIHGTFPLSGKEALGIRMFLFSTIIGQVVFTSMSGFDSPIGLQMVENVPFCHALSKIVLARQGYGIESLSTILVLFGLSSIVVGIVFYVLGRLKLGRIVYYFPNHVLVGCIGGIGVFIAKTGVEVSMDSVISWRSITEKIHVLLPLVFFESLLRLLQRLLVDRDGKAMIPLLSPIYFCMITPMFYTILWMCRIDMKYINNSGFFFPSLLDDTSQQSTNVVFGNHLFDMWTVIDFKLVSWAAIWDAVPTMIALTLFSLIHVPINIPAYAVSTDTIADMNRELLAHGYSNIISGLCGGLQNYFAYTQSVLYHRSGGHGKLSGIAVAICTTFLFVFGPLITSYIPRCMAGTLLLHVGIDLFLEGVYDSIGKFDYVEYAGIWLITIVMTTRGMEAAMIAGGIAAVSTHAVQSVHYVNPIRGSMTASTLRSSRWNRTNEQLTILDDESVGRNRILVVQLQGHLFFGNMAQFMENVTRLFIEKATVGNAPWIVLLDFSLVLGIDSSAAQTMTKLASNLRKSFGTDLCVFVSGSDAGFPCEFDLSNELVSRKDVDTIPDESTALLKQSEGTAGRAKLFSGNRIEQSLDLALAFAEDCLLYREGVPVFIGETMNTPSSEQELAKLQIANISPADMNMATIELLFSYFHRETYHYNDLIWNQGSPSDSMKLLVQGQLIARLENEAGTKEIVHEGNMIGERGLLQGLPRMSSLQCHSENAILYSLSRESFESLCQCAPEAARLVDLICIRYLSNRVQHVSNRIFETRCLPI